MGVEGRGGEEGGGKAGDITEMTTRHRPQSPTELLLEMTRRAQESSKGTSTKNEDVPGTDKPQEASEAEDDVRTTQPAHEKSPDGRSTREAGSRQSMFTFTVRVGIPARQYNRRDIVDTLRCGVEKRTVIQQKQ